MNTSGRFAELFRKYRLRSQFEKLSEFGTALASEGYVYEDSLFSHWQKGSRVPKDRSLLIVVLRVFIQHDGINTLSEANGFLKSAGMGYLTDDEIDLLPKSFKDYVPFHAPRQIDHYINRNEIEEGVLDLVRQRRTVVLYGPSGAGKTALATHIAHSVRDEFPDGIFWFNIDVLSTERVLLSIAHEFGYSLMHQQSLNEIVDKFRTIVSNKNALFIYDNATERDNLQHLMPNSSGSAVLVTSQSNSTLIHSRSYAFSVGDFSVEESLRLFGSICGDSYVSENETSLLALTRRMGSLPLAIHISAQKIALGTTKLSEMLTDAGQISDSLSNYTYRNTSLRAVYQDQIGQLSGTERKVLLGCVIFSSHTFTSALAAAMQQKPQQQVRTVLNQLVRLSLLDSTGNDRYRVHPLLHVYLKEHSKSEDKLLKPVIRYLITAIPDRFNSVSSIRMLQYEADLIISFLKKCLETGRYSEAHELWQVFGDYYQHISYWKEYEDIVVKLYNNARDTGQISAELALLTQDITRMYYYDGDISKAEQYTRQALQLAKSSGTELDFAKVQMRFGKITIALGQVAQGMNHLNESLDYFTANGYKRYASHVYRYMSEGEMAQGNLDKAEEYTRRSLENLDAQPNWMHTTIYTTILETYLGIIALAYGNFQSAKEYLNIAIAKEKSVPHARGTYTWLARLALSLTLAKEGFVHESAERMKTANTYITFLGVEKSYPHIHTYAQYIRDELLKSDLADMVQ